MNIDGAVDLAHIDTPAAPSTGRNKLYFKSDAQPYFQSSTIGEKALGTRWGTTDTWAFADSTDVAVTFYDGYRGRVGDLVVSKNGFSLGEVYQITAMYSSGNADVASVWNGTGWMHIRGPYIEDTGWTAGPTLQNGWIQYAGWETFAYRRKNGIVYLKGLLQAGTVTSGTLLFTLPAGYRCGVGGTTHTQVASGSSTGGAINIGSTGDVLCNYGISGWVSLNNVSFPADA